MLVKFLQTIRLKVFRELEREEVLSLHRAGAIEKMSDDVGRELVERKICIAIPSTETGASVPND